MDYPSAKRAKHSTEESSLLKLTIFPDNCLFAVFKCLEISDIVSLSSTCRTLRRFVALYFEKLHTLRLFLSSNNKLNMLKRMQMPALRKFSFTYKGSPEITFDNVNNILSFLEYKPTLDSMVLVDYPP